MTFKRIKNSFGFAWNGIKFFLRERNIKVHLTVALLVLAIGFYFGVTNWEWVAIIFSIVLVVSLEIVNTVIEEAIDLAHPQKDERVMVIKDLAAAAVLVAAFGAMAIGVIVFLPHVLSLLQ